MDQPPKARGHADQEILIEQEEGLHGANLAARVSDHQIAVVELGVERVLHRS